MTPQEQQMIQGLIDRIRQTPPTDKDADAERLLQQGLGQSPDALYVLAQTVLVQNYALEQAQKQMKDLREQMEQARQQQQVQAPPAPEKHTSFLGSIFGKNDDAAPQTSSVVRSSQTVQGYAPAPPPPMLQYAPVPGYGGPAQGYAPVQQSGSPMGGFGQAMGGGGGFLRGAAQTAAGVAAGALAFEGIESLMHGFGGGGGMGSGLGGFGGGAPREEVINNYYGDSGGQGGHEGRSDDSGFYNPSDDASREGLGSDVEDRRGFADSGSGGDDFSASNGGDDLAVGGSDDYAGGDTSSDDGSGFNSGDSFGGGDDSSFS